MKDTLTTGRLGSPFGLKGYIKVVPFSVDLSHFFSLTEVKLEKQGKQRIVNVENVTEKAGTLLIKFKGTDTPEQARLLSGSTVIIKREDASQLGEDEVYVADLIDLKIVFQNEVLGRVKSVSEGFQAPLLNVLCTDGKERIIPYLKNVFVKKADIQKGEIELLMRTLIE